MTASTCPNCNNNYRDIISLAKHWSRTHKLSTKYLWLRLNNLDNEPTCGCGCGSAVKFLDAGRGFSTFVWGHAARIKNNYQTEKSRMNSRNTRRQRIKDGTYKPWFEKATGQHWGLGKTKDTDKRIARMTAAIVSNKDEMIRRAERMSEGRRSGRIPTLRGVDSPNWKGGISPLGAACRANQRLYLEWTYPILKLASFRCSSCETSNGKLHVHHDKETFSQILRSVANSLGWSDQIATSPNDCASAHDLKQQISDAVADYHVLNKVSGIALCKSCHKKIHKSLNF